MSAERKYITRYIPLNALGKAKTNIVDTFKEFHNLSHNFILIKRIQPIKHIQQFMWLPGWPQRRAGRQVTWPGISAGLASVKPFQKSDVSEKKLSQAGYTKKQTPM